MMMYDAQLVYALLKGTWNSRTILIEKQLCRGKCIQQPFESTWKLSNRSIHTRYVLRNIHSHDLNAICEMPIPTHSYS